MLRVALHSTLVFALSTSCILGAVASRLQASEVPVAKPVDPNQEGRGQNRRVQKLGSALSPRRSATAKVSGVSRRRAEAQQAALPEEVSLEQLYAEPHLWLGKTVRAEFQLASVIEGWNPYLTRFGTEGYEAIRSWSPTQWLWELEQFEQPVATLFAPKHTYWAKQLTKAKTYQRFEAVLEVRQLHVGRPWIEITSLTELPRSVSDGVLIHASRGLLLMQNGQMELACDEFGRARAGGIFEAADQKLAELLQACEQSQQSPNK